MNFSWEKNFCSLLGIYQEHCICIAITRSFHGHTEQCQNHRETNWDLHEMGTSKCIFSPDPSIAATLKNFFGSMHAPLHGPREYSCIHVFSRYVVFLDWTCHHWKIISEQRKFSFNVNMHAYYSPIFIFASFIFFFNINNIVLLYPFNDLC